MSGHRNQWGRIKSGGLYTGLKTLSLAALSALGLGVGSAGWDLQLPGLSAQEILRTHSEGELTVDGLFHDWSDQRSASFEHHARHGMANREDLRGRLSVALSHTDLHFMAEIFDDDLRAKSGADYVTITLASGERTGKITGAWRVELKLDVSPMLKGQDPRVLKGRGAVAGARAKGLIWWGDEPRGVAITDLERLKSGATTGRGGLRVELAVPLSQLPRIKGQRVGIMGSFFDFDQGRLESVYSTEVSTGGLSPLRANWVLGGNAAYRTLYESVHRAPLTPIEELEGDWVGDSRPESIYVTDADVIVLGPDLPNRGSFAKWSHGWRGAVQVESMTLRRSGSRATLVLVHIQRRPHKGEELVERVIELYHLDAEGLRPVFAQVSELRWGQGRAAVQVDLAQSLKRLTVTGLQAQGLSREELNSLPSNRGVHPVAGEDGKGRPRRYSFNEARWAESRED